VSRKSPVQHVDVDHDELRRRLAAAPLSDEDKALFGAVLDTFALMTQALDAKRVSIERLRRLVFGARTEKLRNLDSTSKSATTEGKGDTDEASGHDASHGGTEDDCTTGSIEGASQPRTEKRKPKGHGRHGAQDYTGATQRDVPHPLLHHGDTCPGCCQGKLCAQTPLILIRLRGAVPVTAERTNVDRLRCALCGEVFTADVPDDVKDEKYDEGTMAIVSLIKYGSAMPFHRLARLQSFAGVPLPASTQWQLCEKTATRALPVFLDLIRYGAQGGLIYTDDTHAKILGPVRRPGESALDAAERVARAQLHNPNPLPVPPTRPKERTGTFTSGMVSNIDGHDIVLFQTGWRHAGDNLEQLLSHRSLELELPIQMCDALSRNVSGDFETIVANCLSHARREFADLAGLFSEPCLHVIRQLAAVYHNDSEAKSRELSPEQRLAWHQQHSGPIMNALEEWMKTEVVERRIEPNSVLGSAIKYMETHWSELTLFLRVAGAPLDNNLCERILKRAILCRKNSLFFRTERGALVADICMSLIQTAEMSKKNPLHYLTSLLEHHLQVAATPSDWLPWNYEETLASLQAVAA
jgi:transposase